MDTNDQPIADIVDLGAASAVTLGMMGEDIEGFELQPHAGLSDL